METNKEFVAQRVLNLEGGQSSGEYVLPDYLGDVKKVLFTKAYATPAGKYKNGDVLDVVGVVCYDIVYVDSEDKITPLSFTTDYELSFRINDESYVDAAVSCHVGNFSVRPMGPRRFSAKAALECECLLWEAREYVVDGDTFSNDGAISRCKNVGVVTGAYAAGDEREFAEEISRIEGAIVDEVEVLYCDVECKNISATASEAGAEVKADVVLSLLIKCAGEAPYAAERVLNFASTVSSDAFEDEMSLRASVDVLSKRAEVNPEADGVSVVASVILIASVCGVGNVPLRLVSDCSSTVCECDVERRDYAYTEHIGARSADERVSFEMSREATGLGDARNILFASCEPRLSSAAVEDNGVKIEAVLRFSGIACEVNEDGTIAYSPIKIDVPYAHKVNYDLQIPEKAKARVYLSATSARIDIDGESVRPACSLGIYSSVECDKSERCVSASRLGAQYPEADQSLVRVYYPEAGESLFDVAKRFHTSPHLIANDNELTAEVFAAKDSPDGLSSVKYLLIK